MKFRYARYGQTLRPVIPIKLKHNGQEIGYQVLVDSGADLCLFDAAIGQAIGIDLKKGSIKTVIGVGGKASVYYLHKIHINVGGWEREIEAGFMPQVAGYAMPHGLVGQKGFFEHFSVKFNLRKEEIELKALSTERS